MATTIFYFSATGNSLKVARDLANELGDTEIVSIPKALNNGPNFSAERIGIIFPVYMFGMPLIVSRFIRSLKAQGEKYVFAVATCGGKAADSLGQTERELEANGLKLSAGFIIRMPGNYTPLYGCLPEDKQARLFEKEKARIKEIAAIVRGKNKSKIEKDALLLNFVLSRLLYKAMSPKIPFLDKDFWSDEKCNSCGVCARACPVNNIKLVNGKPVWLHKCEQCFACLHWCPQEAIQYAKNTSNRKRYRNPEVKLEDITG